FAAIPLAATLATLLDALRDGLGCPVEIEFAVETTPPATFHFLQVRPQYAALGEGASAEPALRKSDLICRSRRVLGIQSRRDLPDLLFVPRATFERARTQEIARQVAALNAGLVARGRPYLLIGPGRWGTADRWLGIPVAWPQIAGAAVIVETGIEGFPVEPS